MGIASSSCVHSYGARRFESCCESGSERDRGLKNTEAGYSAGSGLRRCSRTFCLHYGFDLWVNVAQEVRAPRSFLKNPSGVEKEEKPQFARVLDPTEFI